MWPPQPRRLRLDVGVEDQHEDEEEPQPQRRRKKARRRGNQFIELEAGVDGDATEDESDGNDDLDGFIVPDDEF